MDGHKMTDKLPRWQLTFPTQHVIIAEILALTAVAALARHVWWTAAIAVAPILIVAGLRYRDQTVLGWAWRWARSARRRTVELPGVGPIGIRYDGQYVITVIALHGHAFGPTTLVRGGADTADVVPLEA